MNGSWSAAERNREDSLCIPLATARRCRVLLGLILAIGTFRGTAGPLTTWSAEPAAAAPARLTSLEAGRRQALASGKPLLIRVGADWCPACRTLAAEFAKPEVAGELENWTLVEINVDRAPDAARMMNVTVLPALRLRTAGGQPVAALDGKLAGADLVAWLQEHLEAARAAPDEVLLQTYEPDLVAVIRLIRHFDDRDPAVRQAAIGRLKATPEEAGTAVLKAFRDGSLATRLSAMELFERWRAPVADLDPWQPATITAERLALIERWLEQLPEASAAESSATTSPAEPRSLSAAELADARRQLDRLLRASDEEADAIRDQLAQFGESLRDELHRRFQEAETDRDRERLRALRYRLAATEALVLRWPGGLSQLAATDAAERRRAADSLARQATPAEQPLLLELFSDADPLVREIALRGLKDSGGPAAAAALVKLLGDPEPNVRAAVLKQLEEEPQSDLIPAVAEYVKTETNADLIVHAIRFLQATGDSAANRTLMGLLKHDSWQVRAEAAAGLGKSDSFGMGQGWHLFERDSQQSTTEKVDIYVALLELLDDPDPFVVSRAVEGLSGADLEVAVEPLARAAARHPDLARPILALLAAGEAMSRTAVPHLRKFAGHENPTVRAAAVAGLAKRGVPDLEEILLAAFDDAAASVRIAAANAVFDTATREGRELLNPQVMSAVFGDSPQPTTVPNAVPNADDEKTDQHAEPQESEWDRWLMRLYAGAHRPDFLAATVAPLQRLLASPQPDERAAAAQALVPLGQGEQALPALMEAVRADPKTLDAAHQSLPWLLSSDRQRVFQELLPLAVDAQQLATLIQNYTEVVEIQHAESLWKLLADERLIGVGVDEVIRGLQKVYLGEASYSLSEGLTASQRRATSEAVNRWLETGTDWQRIAALVLLVRVDPDGVNEPAARMADDEQRSVAIRETAFQIQLASQTSADRKRTAGAALEHADPWRRRLALQYFAAGASTLAYLRTADDSFTYMGISTSDEDAAAFGRRSGEPIVPTPPTGLKAAQVAPLLADSDPKVVAHAAYLLTLFGDPAGLPPLLKYWRSSKEDRAALDKFVYRAIAALNDSSQIPVLREIYGRLDKYEVDEFYWTIRIIDGPEILPFRKQVRADMQKSGQL